jgi:hypothetical protein
MDLAGSGVVHYTQSGIGWFLAYSPSWWKNLPWLERLGGARLPPFHSIFHHVQSCSVRSSWEGRYTPCISSLPDMYSMVMTIRRPSLKGEARRFWTKSSRLLILWEPFKFPSATLFLCYHLGTQLPTTAFFYLVLLYAKAQWTNLEPALCAADSSQLEHAPRELLRICFFSVY